MPYGSWLVLEKTVCEPLRTVTATLEIFDGVNVRLVLLAACVVVVMRLSAGAVDG